MTTENDKNIDGKCKTCQLTKKLLSQNNNNNNNKAKNVVG